MKRQTQEDQPSNNNNNNNQPENQPIALTRRDSKDSVYNDDIWTGKSRITTLKAVDPEVIFFYIFYFSQV